MLHGVWKNHEKYVETYWKTFKKDYDTSDGALWQGGLIKITGRTDDVMKVAGHRLSTAELENSITDLNSKLEAAKKETEDSNSKLADAEKTIAEMNKDRATETRMKDLVDSGIALSNKEVQTAKVREMTDEEFASYKDELISLRKAIEEELAKTAQAADEQAKKEQEEKEKAAAAAKEEEDKKAADTANAVTPPPEVNKESAAKAALNLEIKKDDILTKYAEMGKAMAQRMVEKNK
jgi:chromosome segregation ATPase